MASKTAKKRAARQKRSNKQKAKHISVGEDLTRSLVGKVENGENSEGGEDVQGNAKAKFKESLLKLEIDDDLKEIGI